MNEHRIHEILDKLNSEHGIDEKEIEQHKVDFFNNSIGHKNEIDGYDCSICHNKGFIAKLDENGNEIFAYCKCHRIREMLHRAKNSGLGNILVDYSFDKFIDSEGWQRDNKEKAKEFCTDEAARWFYIGGQVGSGKTHLCTAICAHYIKVGYDVIYMLWVEEAKKLKALVNEYYEYQQLIDKYKNAAILYIDDFLKVQNGEEPTKADINLAFEILNSRLLSKDKITIISSEKTLIDLLQYDEATMSRIYQQTGKYKIIIEKDLKKNYRLKE